MTLHDWFQGFRADVGLVHELLHPALRRPLAGALVQVSTAQSINQFTFLVFRTHQGSRQTMTENSNIH